MPIAGLKTTGVEAVPKTNVLDEFGL